MILGSGPHFNRVAEKYPYGLSNGSKFFVFIREDHLLRLFEDHNVDF